MKRSEFEKARRVHHERPGATHYLVGEELGVSGAPLAMFAQVIQRRVAEDVAAAEAAGVVWDPEAEPMAPTLEAVVNPIGEWSLRTAQWGCGDRDLTEREARAAAEAYNRRGAVAQVAKELAEGGPALIGPYRALGLRLSELASRLEGAHGADAKDGEGRS